MSQNIYLQAAMETESLFKPVLFIFLGVSFMFDTEGRRVTNMDQIMDGGIYICSSTKRFLPGNYGSYGEKTEFRAPDFQINENMADLRSPSPIRGGTTNLFSRKNTVNSAPLSSESPSDFRGKYFPLVG